MQKFDISLTSLTTTQNYNKMSIKRHFKVFKEGVTDNWITIASNNGHNADGTLFDETAKRAKYISLGYQVQDI
jgi:hypothetical protein